MSDATTDRVSGSVDEMKGKGQKALGELTGDDKKKVEGEMNKSKGQVTQKVADAKQAIDNEVKDLTDDSK
jgi:uncharacterized protein YjbJ (UPF0337 family)